MSSKPNTKKSYRRGGSKHYAVLGRASAQSRIRRHITAEVMRDPSRVTTFPKRKRESDAGYDITTPGKFTLAAGQTVSIPLGLRVNCPKGYFYEIRGRSSLNAKGIVVVPGIIDATYTGELVVLLINHSRESQTFLVGDRIAQLLFFPQIHVTFEPVKAFTLDADARGEKGWGSSGSQ